MTIRRSAWPPDFPEVVVHTSVAIRDGHPDYAAAKSGTQDAAARLACALLSASAVEQIRGRIHAERPVIVPVRAVETTGVNLIPHAMAHEMGQQLGLAVVGNIVQTNTVGHTRASGFHRLAFQPTFAGDVLHGRS